MPVFAVGRRTGDAAAAAGFADVASADGNVSGLVRLITERHGGGGPLLHAAGEDRAGDLADNLKAAGIPVQTVVVYRAVKIDRFPKAVGDALTGGRIDGVLHFSRRSAESYLACARTAGILAPALTPSHYCLSRAVAEPLAAADAACIRVADRPNETALLGLIGGVIK